ncbi:MAG: hypothetical protein CM1200mP29_00050 [Verrucomicrobiota bacterium]|nr:MAG: hypothetical protein CM1200mP29_00050 [Verrucomicrobiota bacterium]
MSVSTVGPLIILGPVGWAVGLDELPTVTEMDLISPSGSNATTSKVNFPGTGTKFPAAGEVFTITGGRFPGGKG